jgi:hypothetical protein
MMKHRFPVFFLIIPVGALVIILTLFLVLNLYKIAAALGALLFRSNPVNFDLALYIAAVLIPVISGTIMGLTIVIFSKYEDREYERLWKDIWNNDAFFYGEFAQCFDSIDSSISRLEDTSEKIKYHTKEIKELGRHIAGISGPPPVVKAEKPEFFSITMGDSKVTNFRVIRPADDLIPQEPVPLPQSHQTVWFFPRK